MGRDHNESYGGGLGGGIVILLDFVPVHAIIHEIKRNVPRHYTEMTDGDDYGPPDIDWDLYDSLSHEGQIVAATLRDAGELVGYAVFSLSANPRYKTRLEADNQGFFVEKAYRLYWAKPLIKKAISTLQAMGCKSINFTLSDDRVGKWLGGLGAKSKYKVWSLEHGV